MEDISPSMAEPYFEFYLCQGMSKSSQRKRQVKINRSLQASSFWNNVAPIYERGTFYDLHARSENVLCILYVCLNICFMCY